MRPYQLDVINAVLGTLREGEYTRLGVSAPTGEFGSRERLRTRRAGKGGKRLQDSCGARSVTTAVLKKLEAVLTCSPTI